MAIDPNVLELIRRQSYSGGNSSALDFNDVWNGAGFGRFDPAVADSQVGGAGPGAAAPSGVVGGLAPPGLASAIGLIGSLLGVPAASLLSNIAISNINSQVVADNLAAVPAATNTVADFTALDSQTSSDDSADSVSSPDGSTTSGSAPDGDATSGTVGGDDGSADGGSVGGDGSSSSGGGDGGTGGGDGGGDGGAYAFGGFVPGHDLSGSDNRTVQVTGGEFVVPTNIVDMLGRNFFEKLLLTKSPLQEAAEKDAARNNKGS